MSKSMASRLVGVGPTWLERRQLGLRNPLGTSDVIYEQMYSRFIPCKFWDYSANSANASIHGGVFSLEFSPEGSLLVAACEKRSVLVFDPLTYKEIHAVENAHDDCVNCVKFLDSRTFATCSDDFTVALWDARNLSQKVRTFKGHTNWVKNIEYCPQDGLLVTSGFDGNVLTWEMNKYREGGMVYNKVFSTNGLMRTCLTPDASKMVICTTAGYLIVIHNLDLNTLTQDLDGFRPNMYRLMQLSQTILPIASDFTHLFRGHGKRNRVEFIADFPKDDDAEVVSSLQVHPDGHSAISRNVTNGELSEWSCIHNIEERLSSDESDDSDNEDSDSEGYKTFNWSGSSTSISTTPSYIIQHAHIQNGTNRSRSNEGTSSEQRDLSVSPADVWEALVAIQEARVRRERDRMTPEFSVRHIFRRHLTEAGILVRPVHSGPESRIFETRILPNNNTAIGDQRSSYRTESGSVFRAPLQNSSLSVIGSLRMSDASQSESPTFLVSRMRRRVPLHQRFCSLYRRSLVGQYDRTSISRKPIYKARIKPVKLRRIKRRTKLHTNYEMNETQRLQNELNESQGNPAVSDVPGTSGSRDRERSRSFSRSRIHSSAVLPVVGRTATDSNSPTQAAASTVSSIFNTFRVIENNLNSIRETVTEVEGRINSTLQVLRRSWNLRLSAEESNEGNDNENVNNNNNNNRNNNNSNIDNGAGGSSNDDNFNSSGILRRRRTRRRGSSSRSNSSDNNDDNDNSNNNNSSRNNGVVEGNGRSDPGGVPGESSMMNTSRDLGDTSAADVRSSWLGPWRNPESRQTAQSEVAASSSTQFQPNNERTILMGVFRAGTEDGVRGTSMRRHNIAAVTVSSTVNSSTDGHDRMRTRVRNRSSNISNNGVTKQCATVPVNRKIHQNIKRLTHYIEEPNLGKGFIKELCISPDGRVICSPFGNGVRLLSFSPTVQDLSHCYPFAAPIPLHELSLNMVHTNTVVSTKFSPHHNLLVSGCLAGRIAYYQPLL